MKERKVREGVHWTLPLLRDIAKGFKGGGERERIRGWGGGGDRME